MAHVPGSDPEAAQSLALTLVGDEPLIRIRNQ
jgi:hypothetical protein